MASLIDFASTRQQQFVQCKCCRLPEALNKQVNAAKGALSSGVISEWLGLEGHPITASSIRSHFTKHLGDK